MKMTIEGPYGQDINFVLAILGLLVVCSVVLMIAEWYFEERK